MSCPGSVSLREAAPAEVDSPHAIEGTRAHTAAEIYASFEFDLIKPRTFARRIAEWEADTPEEQVEDMISYAVDYVEKLRELSRDHTYPELRVERRVQTGVDQCWGTADAAIVSADRIDVVDYKYGKGVLVRAQDNEQLMLYGLGVVHELGLKDNTPVRLTVFQPRLNNVSTMETTAKKLLAWREKVVKPAAKLALSDFAPVSRAGQPAAGAPAAGPARGPLGSM